MTTYIVLLRGINVGGRNKLKMSELKVALERIGLARVQTYIQSGNVLLEAEEDEAALREKIEREIAATFGITLTAVVRTAEEWERIIRGCPFSDTLLAEAAETCAGESFHVAMLPESPAEAGIEKLAAVDPQGDEYRLVGRDVYLLFRDSIRTSKLAVSLPKLGVQATVRNWNTMLKLQDLVKQRQQGT